MDFTGRYMALVVAAVDRAVSCGLSAEVEYVPTEESFPYVLRYRGKEDEAQHGYLLVFPPVDLYLTSAEIGFVAKYVQAAEKEAGKVVLLFNEPMLTRVSNVLATAGVTSHVTINTYVAEGRRYEMPWSMGDEDTPTAG